MSLLLKNELKQAELNSQKRDELVQQEKHIDLNVVNQVEEKANSLGYGLYKISSKNNASFTQTINDNWDIVIRKNYLTASELTLLVSIQSLIEFQVNAIANRETGQFMTVSEIAKYLGRSRSGVSTIIQSLIKKGIIFEFVNVDEILEFNRNVSSRALFVNPELFYAGDRNKIDGTLTMLINKYDKLEKNNILLDWKVWRKPGHTFGKLYQRKTYLKLKKEC